MRAAALCAVAAGAAVHAAAPEFSTYFADWAQYHAAGYAYTAQDLAPLANRLDAVMYSFVYFCPPPSTFPMPYWAQPPYGSCTDATAYQLMSVDPADGGFLQTVAGFRSTNPGLKLVLSVGGWNFPSAYFSQMAASEAGRTAFIKSVAAWIRQYGADGVDIDWEAPCSAPRADPVEISCTEFQTVADAGGACPQDTDNIVTLFTELRAALGPRAFISLASQAAKQPELQMNVTALAPIVDRFHVMSYDYAVSDLPAADVPVMGPNAPLYNPASAAGAGVLQLSVSQTVQNYLAAGVPASKIHVGIALYGHSYFNASVAAGGSTAWSRFGAVPAVQGACCGPFATTCGGKPGPGAQQCGTMMLSEITAAIGSLAAPDVLQAFDNETQSDIVYFTAPGADGSTEAGTWVTYTSERSAVAIARYAVQQGLGGVFMFDSSMDTRSASGEWTYGVSNAVADALGHA